MQIVGEGLINYGMIATGNHIDPDSLRDAPHSVNPSSKGLPVCRKNLPTVIPRRPQLADVGIYCYSKTQHHQ